MSSSIAREPLSGTIRQDSKIVGGICLPAEDVQEFIDQFNNCYGPLRMHIDRPSFIPLQTPAAFPVGARRRPVRAPQPGFKPLPFDDGSASQND